MNRLIAGTQGWELEIIVAIRVFSRAWALSVFSSRANGIAPLHFRISASLRVDIEGSNVYFCARSNSCAVQKSELYTALARNVCWASHSRVTSRRIVLLLPEGPSRHAILNALENVKFNFVTCRPWICVLVFECLCGELNRPSVLDCSPQKLHRLPCLGYPVDRHFVIWHPPDEQRTRAHACWSFKSGFSAIFVQNRENLSMKPRLCGSLLGPQP